MLTLERCESLILHAVNADALHPALSALEIACHAGDALANAHLWAFMQRKGDLTTVAAQEYVDLSDLPGFRQVLSAQCANGWMHPAGFGAIQDWRKLGGTASTTYSYAVVPNTGTDGAMTYRMELFGTPTDAQTISVWYQGGFQRPQDTTGARIAVPEWCEGLYILFLRAVALGFVEYDTAAMETRLQSITNSSVFMAAKAMDSRMQTNFGQVRGGAVAMQSGSLTGIRMPSSVPEP